MRPTNEGLSMAESIVHGLALSTTVAGSACLYLTAPRQQWLVRALPALPGRIAGVLGLVAGWLLWSVVLHPVTAAFTSVTVAMALFTTMPFAAAHGAALPRRGR